MYSLNVCGSNVLCVAQGPIRSVVLEEHVFRSEGGMVLDVVLNDIGGMKLHHLL